MVKINLSIEERLAKQLDSIAGSIIKALESLEKELSEYITVTNKRLQVLEAKVVKFESLADVTNKGLVGAIQGSSNPDSVKGLAHLSTQSSTTPPSIPKPVQPPVVQPTVSAPPPKTTIPIVKSSAPAPQQPTEEIKLPPVPKPPTFKPTLTDDKPKTDEPSPPTVDKKKPEKKDGDDKEELMSALKIIDSL